MENSIDNRRLSCLEKIQARINGVTLAHKFFEYLDGSERKKIVSEIFLGNSHIVSFEEKGKPVFAAIITVNAENIHVREVGGGFIWKMEACEKYCRLLADYFKKKAITFRARHEAVITVGKRMGFREFFEFADGSKELIKEI